MRLKEVLDQRNMSQRKISILAGISNQDVNQAILGRKPFFPSWRRKISAALDMSEDDLFPEYAEKSKKEK